MVSYKESKIMIIKMELKLDGKCKKINIIRLYINK